MPCPRTQRHRARPAIDLATFRLLARFPNRSAIRLPTYLAPNTLPHSHGGADTGRQASNHEADGVTDSPKGKEVEACSNPSGLYTGGGSCATPSFCINRLCSRRSRSEYRSPHHEAKLFISLKTSPEPGITVLAVLAELVLRPWLCLRAEPLGSASPDD